MHQIANLASDDTSRSEMMRREPLLHEEARVRAIGQARCLIIGIASVRKSGRSDLEEWRGCDFYCLLVCQIVRHRG